MRASLLPDMEAKLSVAEQSRLKREVMISLLNSKADWLEKHLQPLLPPDIYRLAWDNSGTPQQQADRALIVAKYLKKIDIRLEEHGLNARLFRGKELISQFFVKLSEQ